MSHRAQQQRRYKMAKTKIFSENFIDFSIKFCPNTISQFQHVDGGDFDDHHRRRRRIATNQDQPNRTVRR